MSHPVNVRITISYGYDIHTLELSAKQFEKINGGLSIDVNGQGFFIEGEKSQDIWSFKNKCIHVTCDNGFDVFEGTLDDIIGIEKI